MSGDFASVSIQGVTKVYGATRALGGVTTRFERGVTAIVGPNGSGKSTLLGVLATLVRPTSGTVRFGDVDGRDRAVRRAIGYCGHSPLLWADLTPRECLEVFATLHDLPPATAAAALEREGAAEYADRPCRGLSRGQLQRVSLARALLATPRVLLLDEPTTGLDDASIDRLAGRLREERERGAIVVLATHDGAAKALADRTIALERGRIV
jgi:heme exporter protein A